MNSRNLKRKSLCGDWMPQTNLSREDSVWRLSGRDPGFLSNSIRTQLNINTYSSTRSLTQNTSHDWCHHLVRLWNMCDAGPNIANKLMFSRYMWYSAHVWCLELQFVHRMSCVKPLSAGIIHTGFGFLSHVSVWFIDWCHTCHVELSVPHSENNHAAF